MFEFIGQFFYITLYQPLFNLLVFLYNYTPGPDFGIAIILLTIIIRVIIYPLSASVVRSQKNMQRLQPKLEEIQEKYKHDKQKQGIETLNLYKSEKVNPFAGIFLAFVQLPILICLYNVFWGGLKPEELSHLYSFVQNPGQIHHLFLNIIDLSKPNFIFAILAGIAQYFQAKTLTPPTSSTKSKQNDMAQMMQKQMMYFLPVVTVIILVRLPSALGLYWIVSSLISIAQQYFITKKTKEPNLDTKK